MSHGTATLRVKTEKVRVADGSCLRMFTGLWSLLVNHATGFMAQLEAPHVNAGKQVVEFEHGITYANDLCVKQEEVDGHTVDHCFITIRALCA